MKPSLRTNLRVVAAIVLLALGVVTADAAGGPGNALQFPLFGGPNVTITNAPALNAYPLTVTAWIKTDMFTFGGTPAPLISKSVSEPGWQLSIVGGNIAAGYAPGGGNYVGTGTIGLTGTAVNDNQWHHVAFTVDASGGRLYRDGVLVASGNWVETPTAVTNSSDLTLGRPADGFVNPYLGLMDEVMLWNVALSQAQIQSNMNRSLTGSEPGLIAYYRCDETAGPTTFDNAPAGGTNHGVWSSVTATNSTLVPFTPFVETVAATNVGPTNATLNGVANAWGTNTSVWFEWGTTTNYGNVTALQAIGSGTNAFNYFQNLSPLIPGATYHYRAVASNALGLVRGTNATFLPPVFTMVTNFPGAVSPSLTTHARLAWGDFDNDGRLDVTMVTAKSGNLGTVIFSNTVAGFFRSQLHSSLINNFSAAGDYDNDGRLDFAATGSGTDSFVYLWRNTVSGYTNVSTPIPVVSSGALDWGDFDNDGSLDLLVAGVRESGFHADVWKNSIGGFGSRGAGFPQVTGAAAAGGDFDNDGWLDLLLTGFTTNSISQVWRNTANGFTNINAGLPGVNGGSVVWGDYDNDGQLDILMSGQIAASNGITQVWRNTGNGFSNISAGLPGVYASQVAWGDYDNDGYLDIALTGTTNGQLSGGISQIWRNTGSGFTNINAGLPGARFSSVAWGDYDNDGRLDLLLGGEGIPAQLWKNNSLVTNTPPSAPTGLTIAGNQITWNASTDGQTPASTLTYNLRIGTTPGGVDVRSPMALANGKRLLPQMGNMGLGTNALLAGLSPNRTYYLSVQAVDQAFAGSPFSEEIVFTTHAVAGPAAAPAPAPGDQNGDGIVSQSELAAVLANLNGNGVVGESSLNLVLSNYFANSPWLNVTNVAGLGQTNIGFFLESSVAPTFSAEYSTNLTQWLPLGPATPRYDVTDTNAPSLPLRYYRLRWP